MSQEVVVYKNRTNELVIRLGINVSGDTFSSHVRTQPTADAPLIFIWSVDFKTDGSDGELILTVDNAVTATITAASGYMDLKRTSDGEPIPVFAEPVEVRFIGAVTP